MATSTKKVIRKPYSSITRSQCLEVILNNASVGVTTVVRGHNGSGKTALRYDLQKRLPNHRILLCDMSVMEAGDLAMPKFKEIDGVPVVGGVPDENLGLHINGPVVLILDEIFKTKRALQVQLAQLLYEHRMGEIELHKDSIVVGFSNLEEEGFGDSSLAFVYNRVQIVEMAKPAADDWINDFAFQAGIHPTIIAAVKEWGPQFFADYRDYTNPDENQYIFHPSRPTTGYVTGRSLERASKILIANEGKLPNDVITHMIANSVGDRAAQDIMAVHVLNADLPSREEIMKNPKTARIPESAGALCLLVYNILASLEKKEVKPWMTYLERIPKKEIQAIFISSAVRSPRIQDVVGADKDVHEWVKKNRYLYGGA